MQAILSIGLVGFMLATCGYLVDLLKSSDASSKWPTQVYGLTCVYWVFAFPYGAYSYPFCTGVRPWLIVSAWSLGIIYLLLQRSYEVKALGSFVAALSTLLNTFALLVSTQGEALLTGSLANWVLWIHIALAFIGVIAFGLASAVSVLYLFVSGRLKQKKQTLQRRLPSLDTLDSLALRSVIIGFPFYTIALLLGSAQAMRQGSGELKLAYIFAAISWLIYGVVLQARLTAGWRGRKAAQLTILGLVSALVVVGLYSAGAA